MSRHRARPFAVAALVASIALAQLTSTTAGQGSAAGDQATVEPRGAGLRAGALLVRLAPGANEAQVGAAFAAAGAVQVGRLDQLHTRVVTAAEGRNRADVMRALHASGVVASVEVDGAGRVTLEPNDPLWPEQWAGRKIRGPRAWDVTTGEDGAVIAILDSGVYAGHNDLQGRVTEGRDFVNDDRTTGDDNGHGTMVAGVAAARGMNGAGVAGTCWRCRIMPIKVVNRNGVVRWSNAAAGLIWATDHGADVINMSFGGDSGNSTLSSAVRYAVEHGVVVVASAGNDGRTARFYPAAYAGVLSVAGTNSSDGLYSWSNRGSWVKLAAPGCTRTTRRGGGYTVFCGTSAAAPIVAGIAGLALSAAPRASASLIKEAIRSSAVYVTSKIGGGRVDAWGAIQDIQ